MLQLLIHQWKEKTRSSFWQRSIFLNVILGVLGFYFLLNIAVIGYWADTIITGIFKTRDVVEVYSGFLFFYFAYDLIIRLLFQELPVLSIQPYLTLPINKSKLLHYPLIKSVPGFFNILALLLILPFFIKVILAVKSLAFSIAWIVSIISLITVNNFLNFSLKKYFYKRPLLLLLSFAMAAVLLYIDIERGFPVSNYFSGILLFICKTPILMVIPAVIGAMSYMFAYSVLKRNCYLEEKQTFSERKTEGLSFLNQYGQTGSLINTEIKMIFRNKRPKSLLVFSFIFLAYGFFLYTKQFIHNDFLLMFAGLFVTSGFAINYGQYLFSWEGSYFDSYIANKISTVNYVKSKFLLIVLVNIFSYILTLPYSLIYYKIGIVNSAMFFYNIGISSFILIFISSFNTSPLDISKSQFMNYQGMGASQFILTLPLFGIPCLVFLLFSFFGISGYCFWVLGLIGLIGIIFNKYLLHIVTGQFEKRKYKMAAGFRQR